MVTSVQRLALLPALLSLSFFAPSLRAQTNLAVYGPDQYGVSFRYAAKLWKNVGGPQNYLPSPITTPEAPALAVLELTRNYPMTDFGGAEFTYVVRRNSSAEACRDVAKETGNSVREEVISGMSFTHRVTSDAAMMHQRTDNLYTLSRHGNCYLFDLGLMTAGYGATDGIRRMTDAETAQVQRQLREVLKTVQMGAIQQQP